LYVAVLRPGRDKYPDRLGWFFGIKLDGPTAGIYLSARMAGAIIIMYLMAHYPEYRRQSVNVNFAYSTFLCLDSLFTLQANPHDTDYPKMMTGLFFLAMLLLIVHGTLSRIQPQEPVSRVHDSRFCHSGVSLPAGISISLISLPSIQ
jgi:hypothetical protein